MIGANTRQKSSGLLQYWFGASIPPGETQGPYSLGLVGAAPPTLITCLGPDAEVTPDINDMVFGVSAGSVNGVAPGAGFFGGALPVAPWDRSVPKQYTGREQAIGFPQGAGRSGYIPQSTQVWAHFVPAAADVPGAPAGALPVNVQVRTLNSEKVANGVAIPEANGGRFLTFVQIGIQNPTGGWTLAGVLYVHLQHSRIDVPGINDYTSPSGFQQ